MALLTDPSDAELVREAVTRAIAREEQEWGLRIHPGARQGEDATVEPGQEPDEGGHVRWRPLPSTVSDEQIDELEREVGLPYPPIHRTFLRTVHYPVEIQLRSLRLTPHPATSWRDEQRRLHRAFDPERTVRRGLLPFAYDNNDAGLLCYDTTRPDAQRDCPAVLWDHDSLPEREVRLVFSSGRKMFECLWFELEHDTDFLYADEETSAPELEIKRRDLIEFLRIDPAGAGGEAWAYWTSWFAPEPPPDLLDGARASIERELEIDRRNYGSRHPSVPQRLRRLAALEDAAGNAERAAALRREADEPVTKSLLQTVRDRLLGKR